MTEKLKNAIVYGIICSFIALILGFITKLFIPEFNIEFILGLSLGIGLGNFVFKLIDNEETSK